MRPQSHTAKFPDPIIKQINANGTNQSHDYQDDEGDKKVPRFINDADSQGKVITIKRMYEPHVFAMFT